MIFRYKTHRRWEKRCLPRLPRLRRLPWFRCRHCLARLAQMDVVDGLTCIPLGGRGVTYHTWITCQRCGNEREFRSIKAIPIEWQV